MQVSGTVEAAQVFSLSHASYADLKMLQWHWWQEASAIINIPDRLWHRLICPRRLNEQQARIGSRICGHKLCTELCQAGILLLFELNFESCQAHMGLGKAASNMAWSLPGGLFQRHFNVRGSTIPGRRTRDKTRHK